MLIPIRHENMTVRRWPLITIGLIALNVVAFVLTIGPLLRESTNIAELRTHICLLAATHPDLEVPPSAQKMVDDTKRRHPDVWRQAQSPTRRLEDGWDAEIRMIDDPAELQQQMNSLAARYDRLSHESILQRYAIVPASPTWYSFVTSAFLHGGILHLLGNMWFLWLAGLILEDVWGRGLYAGFYLFGAIFAALLHMLTNGGSYVPMLGASGAVAALMGAFLVRFPRVKIEMMWFWGFLRISRFSMEAFWLLPIWFAMELFSGVLFGAASGTAHMAHVGGFLFGVLAGLGIHRSGLEHVINKSIELQVDPLRESELDRLDQLVRENQIDDALSGVSEFLATDPVSERALLLQQELRWRVSDFSGYGETTEKLCALRLAKGEIEAALKDYESMVEASGTLLSPETWFKLCQSLDAQREHERALGEYQELAMANPEHRLSLMALLNGARLALYKLQRPQQAVNLFEAASQSPVPHLEMQPSIDTGLKEARATLALAAPLR